MSSAPLEIPLSAERFGFSSNSTGGLMARSMMLEEVSALAGNLPAGARPNDFKTAVVSDNLLGKPTFASREKSLRHLVQLYGLDPGLALFRLLRRFAGEDSASLPLIAVTCVFCRDPQLRHSFALVDRLRPGEALPRERMEAHLEAGFPGRFSAAMKKSLAQNVGTTWTAAGHLTGRIQKVRSLPKPRLAASVYAMVAGYLLGFRGETLVQSVFSRLVAPDPAMVIAHLSMAAARGWLRFRHAGGVMEVDFSPLLTEEERQLLHATD